MHIKTNPKDKISFNQLYNDYQTRFLNFANTYVRDWDVAEDITTEALIIGKTEILYLKYPIFLHIYLPS